MRMCADEDDEEVNKMKRLLLCALLLVALAGCATTGAGAGGVKNVEVRGSTRVRAGAYR